MNLGDKRAWNVHSDPGSFITDLYLFWKERVGDEEECAQRRSTLTPKKNEWFYLSTDVNHECVTSVVFHSFHYKLLRPQRCPVTHSCCFNQLICVSLESICAQLSSVSPQLLCTINLTHSSCTPTTQGREMLLYEKGFVQQPITFYGWIFIFPINCQDIFLLGKVWDKLDSKFTAGPFEKQNIPACMTASANKHMDLLFCSFWVTEELASSSKRQQNSFKNLLSHLKRIKAHLRLVSLCCIFTHIHGFLKGLRLNSSDVPWMALWSSLSR